MQIMQIILSFLLVSNSKSQDEFTFEGVVLRLASLLIHRGLSA